MMAPQRHLTLRATTWNLGDSPVGDLELGRFVDGRASPSDPLPDVIAFSFQEMAERKDFLDAADEADEWTETLTTELVSRGYVKLAAVRMEAIALIVFILRSHLTLVRNLRTAYTKTGMGGLKGNKGGVTVRFTIFGREICVVGCHLAAHLSENAERIVDFTSILDDQSFEVFDASAPTSSSKTLRILDHDYVVVGGDLNFRLDDVSREDVIDNVAADRLAVLLPQDQLLKALKAEACFAGFQEAEVTFRPTYKFDAGTDVWDSSNKQRKPAWCDRILWRIGENTQEACPGGGSGGSSEKSRLSAENLVYESFPQFVNSDHKAVAAELKLLVGASPPSPVALEVVGVWRRGRDGVCRLRVDQRFRGSTSDWVGLFPENFPHLKSFVTWYWASSARSSSSSCIPCVKLSSSSNLLRFDGKYVTSTGRHQLVYVAEDYGGVYACSNLFDIKN